MSENPSPRTSDFNVAVMPPPSMRNKRLLFGLLLLFSAGSCNTVAFYEKQAFSSPVMDLGISPTLSSAEQKIFYATEGAAGGLGSSAGGGCGCY
ncbi:MAG: hypothetical protein ACI8Q9_002107 [Planctomycetota bacterium]|jgi:hypothetical protein